MSTTPSFHSFLQLLYTRLFSGIGIHLLPASQSSFAQPVPKYSGPPRRSDPHSFGFPRFHQGTIPIVSSHRPTKLPILCQMASRLPYFSPPSPSSYPHLIHSVLPNVTTREDNDTTIFCAMMCLGLTRIAKRLPRKRSESFDQRTIFSL